MFVSFMTVLKQRNTHSPLDTENLVRSDVAGVCALAIGRESRRRPVSRTVHGWSRSHGRTPRLATSVVVSVEPRCKTHRCWRRYIMLVFRTKLGWDGMTERLPLQIPHFSLLLFVNLLLKRVRDLDWFAIIPTFCFHYDVSRVMM